MCNVTSQLGAETCVCRDDEEFPKDKASVVGPRAERFEGPRASRACRAAWRNDDTVLPSPRGLHAMNGPLVSIVITSHNYAAYLPEAIESAMGQTHHPVEIVVVDDGSTDGSADEAGRYPVRVITQQNQGVSAARNRGAVECAGEYIMFLDADDALEPDYVRSCLDALAAAPHRVAYAYTGMRYFGDECRVWLSRPFRVKSLLRYNYVHASALIRHDVFRRSGGFDTGWRLGHEDHELWVRLLGMGYHGVLVPEPLLRYRRHGASRNTLTKRQINRLKWRLRLSHPRLYRADIVRSPVAALYWMLRLRAPDERCR